MCEDDIELNNLLNSLTNDLLKYPGFSFRIMYLFTICYIKLSIPKSKDRDYILYKIKQVKEKKKELKELYEDEMRLR